MYPSVRMLCRRSANLMSTTRMSSPIARKTLRRVSLAISRRRGRGYGWMSSPFTSSSAMTFSWWWSLRDTLGKFVNFVTPSTSLLISSPNSRWISSRVTDVSSTVSCNKPAMTTAGGTRNSARIEATAMQ